jgi:hypothetical protein
MFTVAFWKGALERSIKTAAGALLTLWTTDVAFDLLNVDLRQALGVALGSAVVSVLMSAASVSAGPAGSPSLVADRPADPENRS